MLCSAALKMEKQSRPLNVCNHNYAAKEPCKRLPWAFLPPRSGVTFTLDQAGIEQTNHFGGLALNPEHRMIRRSSCRRPELLRVWAHPMRSLGGPSSFLRPGPLESVYALFHAS